MPFLPAGTRRMSNGTYRFPAIQFDIAVAATNTTPVPGGPGGILPVPGMGPPGAVAVVSQESYSDRMATGLVDMLRDVPGVYIQKKWGGDTRLSIRGSGIGNANHNRGLLLAQDGVPLNEADGYGDSQIADPLLTRFVEVYRGGNALRFGGALLGGAINLVTPTGRTAGADTLTGRITPGINSPSSPSSRISLPGAKVLSWQADSTSSISVSLKALKNDRPRSESRFSRRLVWASLWRMRSSSRVRSLARSLPDW